MSGCSNPQCHLPLFPILFVLPPTSSVISLQILTVKVIQSLKLCITSRILVSEAASLIYFCLTKALLSTPSSSEALVATNDLD